MARSREIARKGGEKRSREEMPDGVRKLPPKLREAWLAGEFDWSGQRLEDREPVVKTLPGKSVSEIIVRHGR